MAGPRSDSRQALRPLRYASLFLLAIVVPVGAGMGLSARAVGPPPLVLPATVPIVLPRDWWEDPAVRLGAEELAAALRATYGSEAVLQEAGALVAATESAVLVGGPGAPWAPGTLPAEGYYLEAAPQSAGQRWLVAAADPLGAAHGLFRLAELVRIAPDERAWKRQAAPVMALRLLADPLSAETPAPEEALRLGFNAVAINPWPALALYSDVDPSLYDPAAQAGARAWVEDQRRRAGERIAAAKRLHLQVVAPGDLPSLPRQSVDNEAQVCLSQPRVRMLVRAGLDEVLRDFPSIDYVMVRVGENYPLGPLTGTRLAACLPAGQAGAGDYVAGIAEAMTLTSDAARAHGRQVIFRAWDLRTDGLHASPGIVEALAARRPPSGNELLSFKHTQTDFWRYNPPNPNLGGSGFREMVEFQAAREYEGKGAFPNYLGPVYARGAPEAPGGGLADFAARGVSALWAWPTGGGWGGPKPASSLWNEANVYALARLAWEPDASPEQVAREWATLRFGRDAAELLARLLMRSGETARLAFYIGPAAEVVGPWAPNWLWVRDDQIGGTGPLRALYAQSRGAAAFQRALAEKRQAVSLVAAMQGDLAAARPLLDAQLAEQVGRDLAYERSLVETLEHQVAALFYAERWREAERAEPVLRLLAEQHLERWQAAWAAHLAAASLSGSATPYQDAGMAAGMAEVRVILGP